MERERERQKDDEITTKKMLDDINRKQTKSMLHVKQESARKQKKFELRSERFFNNLMRAQEVKRDQERQLMEVAVKDIEKFNRNI